MPYINTVKKYSDANHFQYNHKNLFKQIRAAMKQDSAARENALKDIFNRNFLAEAEKYELMRMKMLHDARGGDAYHNEDIIEDITKNMADSYRFLDQYMEIVTEMAKDVDSSFEPKFMLGLSPDESKNLLSGYLSSYTRMHEAKLLMDSSTWEEKLAHVEGARYNPFKKSIRNYKTENQDNKDYMKEVYIRKEIVKKDIASKGFFWKLFHPSEFRSMRNYVNVAEQALTAVEFPENAGKEAEVEFSYTASVETNYKDAHKYIDKKYEAERQKTEQETSASIKEEAKIRESMNTEPDNSMQKAEDRISITVNLDVSEPSVSDKVKNEATQDPVKMPTK